MMSVNSNQIKEENQPIADFEILKERGAIISKNIS